MSEADFDPWLSDVPKLYKLPRRANATPRELEDLRAHAKNAAEEMKAAARANSSYPLPDINNSPYQYKPAAAGTLEVGIELWIQLSDLIQMLSEFL